MRALQHEKVTHKHVQSLHFLWYANQLYMQICVCVCGYGYVYVYVYTHTHTYISVYIYTYIYMYVCIYMYIYIYVYICIHMYIYVYMYIYIYMYICIYVYVVYAEPSTGNSRVDRLCKCVQVNMIPLSPAPTHAHASQEMIFLHFLFWEGCLLHTSSDIVSVPILLISSVGLPTDDCPNL